MHAKLRLLPTWTPTTFLNDIAGLATGTITSPSQLTAMTATTSVQPENGGIVSTIAPGWELVGTSQYGDSDFPSFSGSTTGSYAILLRAPIDDDSGRYKYLGIQMHTNGYLYTHIGDSKKTSFLRSYFKKTGTQVVTLTEEFTPAAVPDVSFNISARHFAMFPTTYIPSNKSFFLMERTQESPGDVDMAIPPIASFMKGSYTFGVPIYNGFSVSGDYSANGTQPVINGMDAESYSYYAKFGGIEVDGVYRAQLCPVAFRSDSSYGYLGRQHPTIPIYVVGKIDCPNRNLGQWITIGGRTFEIWAMCTSWDTSGNHTVYVEVL
jgi:hypothetical protein